MIQVRDKISTISCPELLKSGIHYSIPWIKDFFLCGIKSFLLCLHLSIGIEKSILYIFISTLISHAIIHLLKSLSLSYIWEFHSCHIQSLLILRSESCTCLKLFIRVILLTCKIRSCWSWRSIWRWWRYSWCAYSWSRSYSWSCRNSSWWCYSWIRSWNACFWSFESWHIPNPARSGLRWWRCDWWFPYHCIGGVFCRLIYSCCRICYSSRIEWSVSFRGSICLNFCESCHKLW